MKSLKDEDAGTVAQVDLKTSTLKPLPYILAYKLDFWEWKII